MFADTSLDFNTYVFTFGKHKDESIQDVFKYDSSYILWCCENLKWFDLDEESLGRVEERALDERSDREEYYDCDYMYGSGDPYW